MPSKTAEPGAVEKQRAELQSVLRSALFGRSPALAHLLSYLCEQLFAGEGDQIKEYSIAIDVFGRPEAFDQDADSIVRVQANRLRKRLAEFYSGEGASHELRIFIPVGQYVPVFQETTERITPGDTEQENKENGSTGTSDTPTARPADVAAGGFNRAVAAGGSGRISGPTKAAASACSFARDANREHRRSSRGSARGGRSSHSGGRYSQLGGSLGQSVVARFVFFRRHGSA